MFSSNIKDKFVRKEVNKALNLTYNKLSLLNKSVSDIGIVLFSDSRICELIENENIDIDYYKFNRMFHKELLEDEEKELNEDPTIHTIENLIEQGEIKQLIFDQQKIWNHFKMKNLEYVIVKNTNIKKEIENYKNYNRMKSKIILTTRLEDYNNIRLRWFTFKFLSNQYIDESREIK